jgi:hypothetical protein
VARDGTLYALGDIEYYAPLGDGVSERFVNKTRLRLGLGYRFSVRTRLDALYMRDSNRSAPDQEAQEDAQMFDVRLELLF